MGECAFDTDERVGEVIGFMKALLGEERLLLPVFGLGKETTTTMAAPTAAEKGTKADGSDEEEASNEI